MVIMDPTFLRPDIFKATRALEVVQYRYEGEKKIKNWNFKSCWGWGSMQYRVTIYYIIYTGTMVKEQFGCVCVLLSTSMTTIVFRDPSPDLHVFPSPDLLFRTHVHLKNYTTTCTFEQQHCSHYSPQSAWTGLPQNDNFQQLPQLFFRQNHRPLNDHSLVLRLLFYKLENQWRVLFLSPIPWGSICHPSHGWQSLVFEWCSTMLFDQVFAMRCCPFVWPLHLFWSPPYRAVYVRGAFFPPLPSTTGHRSRLRFLPCPAPTETWLYQLRTEW